MACRVGITVDLKRRKKEWEHELRLLRRQMRDWEEIAEHPTRESAQKQEKHIAGDHGCEFGEGGDDPENKSLPWYVYHFGY